MTKIYIDGGHGGTDPGAVANGLREKDITLTLAKKVAANLRGIATVKLSRSDDRYLTLTQRANDANAWGADLFVSIHVNAGGGTGFESYVFTNASAESKRAQDAIHSEIMRVIGGTDRGKKNANFAVLRQTKMPAILTECLFIDRAEDASKLKSAVFIDKLAKGHSDGIIKALGLSGNASAKPAPKPKPKKMPVAKKQSTYSGNSIVVYLDSIGVNSSFGSRKKLAEARGIRNYRGTATQNLQLLRLLRGDAKPVTQVNKPSSTFVGKRVESIHSGNLRFYSRGSWSDKHVAGHLRKGYGFPRIVRKVKVGNGWQYEAKNSRGVSYYITASPKYVRVK